MRPSVRFLSRTALALTMVALAGTIQAGERPPVGGDSVDRPMFRVTPKVQYYIQSTNLRSDSTLSQSSSEQFTMPFYGASFEARFPQLSDTEFSLSVTHGSGSFGTLAVNSNGTTTRFKTDVDRTDTEFLVRSFIPQTDFNWTAAFRWIHAPYDLSYSSPGVFGDTGGAKREVNHDYYVLLAGANVDTAISPSGNHRLFGGVNLGVGYQDDSCGNCNGAASPANQSAVVLLPEMNFGYKYQYSSEQFVYIRYKFQGTAGESGTYGGLFDEMQWGHGPEIGFGISF